MTLCGSLISQLKTTDYLSHRDLQPRKIYQLGGFNMVSGLGRHDTQLKSK